jgi:hypothetical protein
MTSSSLIAGEVFESFDTKGKPPGQNGITWSYKDELSPISGWENLIPGDGHAHLWVDRDRLNVKRQGSDSWPFQTISLGPLSVNHSISIRARNAAIPGVTCFLFLYDEGETINEIDLEIVARDTESGTKSGTGTGNLSSRPECTDIRMNTWAEASGPGLFPRRTLRSPVVDRDGREISLRDDRFHVYTIEWETGSVRFYIDNVLQGVITHIVPESPMNVIFGMRKTPWSGDPDWDGRQTLLIDWIDIEPL